VATLLLFHDSVRHSADLDLLPRADKLPSSENLRASLFKVDIPRFGSVLESEITAGLASAADALNLGPLQVEVSGDNILVKKRDNSLL
jgi:hypothetical protein